MVWKWIYHPHVGLANNILRFFGINEITWLSEWRGIIASFARSGLKD